MVTGVKRFPGIHASFPCSFKWGGGWDHPLSTPHLSIAFNRKVTYLKGSGTHMDVSYTTRVAAPGGREGRSGGGGGRDLGRELGQSTGSSGEGVAAQSCPGLLVAAKTIPDGGAAARTW